VAGAVSPSESKVEALKLPPQSLEAEQSLLGAILLDNTALLRVLEARLGPDDFYRETHGLIFEAMRDLFNRNEPVDLITLTEALRKTGALEKIGGPAYLSELAGGVATAVNIEHYARIVHEKSVLRQLITTTTGIAEQCYLPVNEVDQVLDEAERAIFSIREIQVRQALRPVDSKLLNETFKHLTALSERSGSVTGVPTGFMDLDRITSGLQPSDLVVIAGRPSMGKTALALNLAVNAAIPDERDVKGGEPFCVAIFSLEMSTDQLLLRLLCSLSRIDLHTVRTGRIASEDWTVLTEAATKLTDAPIYLDDSAGISVLEIRAKARRLKSRLLSQGRDLGMVVVDYLQLVKGQGDSREQEISEISRSLKALAKELNVPVLALSQLNRQVETRPDKRPMLADLRESGAIEQDADVIAFVFREEMYKKREDVSDDIRGKAELIIGKQRNGPTGRINLTFHHPSTRFLTAAYQEDEY